ncbi:MAG: flagellar biosynthesis protein FlgN [Rhodobacteraceae bacterium]|nr:flagellar biosynthesis protein FlgN [Paracoccaceae bacterium]
MPNEEAQELIDLLDDVLEQERRALIKGSLEQLEDLVSRKEDAISRLGTLTRIEHDSLDRVQDKIRRNQALLTSAMAGIQAVSDRMSELRKAREGLDIYDRSGRRTRYDLTACTKLEKRA